MHPAFPLEHFHLSEPYLLHPEKMDIEIVFLTIFLQISFQISPPLSLKFFDLCTLKSLTLGQKQQHI